MDLLIGKLDMLQDKLVDIERNLRTNESYRNLDVAESGCKMNENGMRARLEEMERSTMARQNDLERKLDKMERELMASKIVYLQDRLQDIEQKLKSIESFREGHVKTAEPCTCSKEENLLDEPELRTTVKEAFLQNKLEKMELANKARDEKLRCLEEKLHDIEQNLTTSIGCAPPDASTKAIEDVLCNKLGDMEQCITADEDVVQSNREEIEPLSTDSNLLKRLTEVENSMKAKEDTFKEAVHFFKETENKLTTQFNSLNEKLEENIENLRDQWSKVLDPSKVVNSLVDSNKYCHNISTKRGEKYRLAFHLNEPALVYCDHTEFGDGWIVFHHRYNGEVNFDRNWADYREGFGSFNGEFWLGLEHLHRLTSVECYQLLIDMEDHTGKYVYAKYDFFRVHNERTEYRLEVGDYSGTAEDDMLRNFGNRFITKDKPSYNKYPGQFNGAWWGYPSPHFNYSEIVPMVFTRMMVRKVVR